MNNKKDRIMLKDHIRKIADMRDDERNRIYCQLNEIARAHGYKDYTEMQLVGEAKLLLLKGE